MTRSEICPIGFHKRRLSPSWHGSGGVRGDLDQLGIGVVGWAPLRQTATPCAVAPRDRS